MPASRAALSIHLEIDYLGEEGGRAQGSSVHVPIPGEGCQAWCRLGCRDIKVRDDMVPPDVVQVGRGLLLGFEEASRASPLPGTQKVEVCCCCCWGGTDF